MKREQISAEVKALAPNERQRLMEDLRPIDDFELTPQQHAELRRRIEQFNRGESKLGDGDTAMRELFAELRRRQRQ